MKLKRISGWGSKYCCGLCEIGDFGDPEFDDVEKGNELKRRLDSLIDEIRKANFKAIYTTTIPFQTHIIPLLKAVGFEAVKEFPGSHCKKAKMKYNATLWFKVLD